MGVRYKRSQGQTKRTVELQEEEEWLRDAPTSLTFKIVRYFHTVFMCFVVI
jgi:hypothetical protein